MPKSNNPILMKASDQVIFFLISITAFMWISIAMTGSYLYR